MFDDKKIKKCIKKAVRGPLGAAPEGQTTITRKNAKGMRDSRETKNAKAPTKPGNPVFDGLSVDPNAMKYSYDEKTGKITERRATRREELNDILRNSSRGIGLRPERRYDKKGLNN